MWRSATPLELPAGTLAELVARAARRAAGRPALIDGADGDGTDHTQLEVRVAATAAGLREHGFRAGAVLALWAPNLPRWAVVALAAMRAGGAVTGVPPSATVREAAGQIADARASILVTVPELADAAREAVRAGGTRVVVADALAARPESRRSAPDGDPGAVALLPYSSGTTGLPTGVALTHRNLVAATRQIGGALGLGPADTVLAFAPFAHVMGFVVTLAAPLAAGATVVTMPRFDLEQALALVERHRVTVLVVPPPVMAALAVHPAVDRHDLSSVELVVSGGAPLGAELQRAVVRRLPRAAVGQGYGMTETAAAITGPDRRTGTPPGSVGRLLPGTELRIVDPGSGRDVGAGERGELWSRGPQVMAGYQGRPAETGAVLTADGWLRTGDLGTIDGDGNVFIVDRLKELIKVNALQVAPAELEALLLMHPGVADAAVIPRPDPRTGEAPVAVVVPRAALDPAQLRAWTAERVAPHKRLREVVVADRIPRTPSGKILRRSLIDLDRARATAAEAAGAASAV